MRVAIANGTIIDGTGAPPRSGSIVVTNDRISSIHSMNDLLPEVDKTIDASGRTILPGLIDAHDHQTYHNTLGLLKWRWSLPRDQLVIRSCIAAVDGLYRTGCILNMTPSANKSVKPALPLEEQAP